MAKTRNSNGVTLGFEATLWKAADKLRNNLDAAEYKHVVLGLIFLKYISDDDFLDDAHDDIELLGNPYRASELLYGVDLEAYRNGLANFDTDSGAP